MELSESDALNQKPINEFECEKNENERKSLKSMIIRYKGFLFAFLSTILFSITNTSIKKANYVAGSDQVCIRMVIQLVCMGFISKAKHLDLLGPKGTRKILMFRGMLAAIGLITVTFSLKLIDPSDSVSILHSNMIVTAITARIFLNEKLGTAHIVSTIVTLTGVVLVSQPSFLFPEYDDDNALSVSSHFNSSHNLTAEERRANRQMLDSVRNIPGVKMSHAHRQTLGVILVMIGSFVAGIVPVVVKHLNNRKVDFKIVIIYAAYFGLPISILISVLLRVLKIDRGHEYLFKDTKLLVEQLLITIFSAVTSMFGQICSNLAYNYEDTSKVQIIRSLDVVLTFILQHFMLDIDSNIYSIIGAILITSASITVISFKILDKTYYDKKLAKATAAKKKPSPLLRCIFYKF